MFPFAFWPGTMWLELLKSRNKSHGPRDVRAIEADLL